MFSAARRLLPSTGALAAFDAVARLESFTAAAAILNLTQGAVSRQVALLEDQLGTKLFERNSKGVFLTEKGKAYAEGVADILERIRILSLEAMSKSAEGSLGLAILPTFGTRWLMPRIPDFVKKNPDITINFATRIGQFDFLTDGLDAAIHVGQPDWPGTNCKFLMHETVSPVCSPAFLEMHQIRSPQDMLHMPLIDMASRLGGWQHWFASFEVTGNYRGVMRFEQFANVAQACIGGLGIALMPTFLIEAELTSGQLVEIHGWRVRSPNAYYLICPHMRISHPPVQKFAIWLADQIDHFLLTQSA